MKNVFTVLTVVCLSLANIQVFAQTASEPKISDEVRQELKKQVEQEIKNAQAKAEQIRAKQIANIGKLGKLTANGSTYYIVAVEAYVSLHPVDGLKVLTMDDRHNLYTSLFSGEYLKQRGIDEAQFAIDLKNPQTVIECKNDGPKNLMGVMDYLYCDRDFTILPKTKN